MSHPPRPASRRPEPPSELAPPLQAVLRELRSRPNIPFHKPGRADVLVGPDAPQRVPTGFKFPMRGFAAMGSAGVPPAPVGVAPTGTAACRPSNARRARSTSGNVLRTLNFPPNIPFQEPGRADVLVGPDAPQRVPTGFMVSMRGFAAMGSAGVPPAPVGVAPTGTAARRPSNARRACSTCGSRALETAFPSQPTTRCPW